MVYKLASPSRENTFTKDSRLSNGGVYRGTLAMPSRCCHASAPIHKIHKQNGNSNRRSKPGSGVTGEGATCWDLHTTLTKSHTLACSWLLAMINAAPDVKPVMTEKLIKCAKTPSRKNCTAKRGTPHDGQVNRFA